MRMLAVLLNLVLKTFLPLTLEEENAPVRDYVDFVYG